MIGEVRTSGQVRFREVALGRTRIEVRMNYAELPSGRVGSLQNRGQPHAAAGAGPEEPDR